ncbi:hypothetical protein [Roseomonas sp. HF4]|uniref:hypothetical protein n=1 Tax=Roseomonas sp. HF4 TaxID=2562313 RepID=UPI0010C0DAE6|nr:hypothetical protein [Roseomonas sp. HF4]
MPAIDDFIAHPRTFMRANVVMVMGTTGGTGGIKNFSFTKATQTTARNMRNGGQAMDVYILKLGDNAGQQLNAWWCPYSSNDRLGTTLPGAGGPNMMFTYAMDGCTFVTGSVQGDKTVSVFHVNFSNAAGALGSGASDEAKAEQQRKLQRNVGRSLVTNAAMIDPDDYYEPTRAAVPIPHGAKISTVTFGRRSTQNGWKFYTHQWYTVAGARQTLCFIGTQRAV